MFKLLTQYPVASDSPDHQSPFGCIRDNNTSAEFIQEVENYFNYKPLHVMDFGCAGGQMIIDFNKLGHPSIGLEGSDVPRTRQLYNWPEYDGKFLFTCDITKPFIVEYEGKKAEFDLITAWEFMEHIKKEDLPQVFTNIYSHLAPNGLFVASIAFQPDVHPTTGQVLHQTVERLSTWISDLIPSDKFDPTEDFPFEHTVRGQDPNYSFLIALRKV